MPVIPSPGDVYRGLSAPGNPASGEHFPLKSEIVDLLAGRATNLPTRADLIASTMPTTQNMVFCFGGTVVGDGLGGLFTRQATEGTSARRCQSADGVWWEHIPDAGGVNSIDQFGALGSNSTLDTAALVAALADGYAYVPGNKAYAFNLSGTQMQAVLPNLDKVAFGKKTRINMGAGIFTFGGGATEAIINVGANGANLELVGAAPIKLTMTSVNPTITGGAHDFLITYNTTENPVALGIAPGHVLRTYNVGPMPIVNGDNGAFGIGRIRPIPNEIIQPVYNTGTITFAAGGGTAAFSGGDRPLSESVSIGDLITCKGQTRAVSSVGGTTVSIVGAWDSLGASGETNFILTLPNSGTVAVSGTTVTGTSTLFQSQANVGDGFLCDGQFIEITAIASNLSMTLATAPSAAISAGAPYSIITNGCYHDAASEITAVTTSSIQIRSRSFRKPPVNRVIGGDFYVLTTVLKATGAGDGLKMGQAGTLSLFENVALLGPRANNGVGILMQGRTDSVPLMPTGLPHGNVTQRGFQSSLHCGGFVAVLDWQYNIMNGPGCFIDARGIASSGAISFALYAFEASQTNLRRATMSGSIRQNMQINAGAHVLGTELKCVSGAQDGARFLTGSTLYAESFFLIGNGVMGLRSFSASVEISIGANLWSGAAAFYIERAGTVDIADYIIAGAVGSGIDAQYGNRSYVVDSWITGCRGNGINNVGSEVVADGTAITGSGNIASYNNNQGTTFIRNGFVRNAVVALRSDGGGIHYASGSRIPSVEVNGTRSIIDTTSPLGAAPTVAGVPRFNEITKDGSVILNGAAASGFGVPGIRIAGGSNTNFKQTVQSTQDCASVGAGLQLALPADITVTGAAVGMIVTVTSNLGNEVLSYYGRVVSANTVRVYVINNSAGAVDPALATYTVSVEGFTA
jgi:hypothetical protein